MTSDIGIKGLVSKNIKEVDDLVKMFIKSSLNVREGITQGDDPDICMLTLIRDTYMCNLLLRYVGLMTLVNPDDGWTSIDNKLMDYVNEYYSDDNFKTKLVNLYEYFLGTYEKNKKNYDYCRFLNKMLYRGEMSKQCVELKNIIRMIENKIFNHININPLVNVNKRHFKTLPSTFEINNDKVTVELTQSNYNDLVDKIDDPTILHLLESQYMSRTKTILEEFSKLILMRQIFAEQSGYETFFKYINRGKLDNSDTIKEFLIELNSKLEFKIKSEITRIHYSYVVNNKICLKGTENNMKMHHCDIMKYVRLKKNNTKFSLVRVLHVIFIVLEKYFNIKIEKTDEKGWNQQVVVYTLRDTFDKRFLGRLFMDVVFNEKKKITNPISIRLSDRMQINPSSQSLIEIALIGNYSFDKGITYNEIVLLFREFGYIIGNMCYESRVGLINYDDEFANYIPSLMEYFAWDEDIIRIIADNMDHSIIDHIILSRDMDMCYNIKLKCVNAKFDHLIHNSEPLLKIINLAIDTKGNANDEIYETYKEIFMEIMEPVSDVFDSNIEHIDPTVIIQEINSSQGVLYSNLMNEIFAYATYWIIKYKSIQNKEIVSTFRKTLLDNGVDNYRELIRKFLKHSDDNCFSLYIKNVIKINMTNECPIEDNNYFEEANNNDSDKEDIIQIKRI